MENNQCQKEFLTILTSLAGSRSETAVFEDFIEAAALDIANHHDNSPVREYRTERYYSITNRYRPEEQPKLRRLLELVYEAYKDNPAQDFLGQIYMAADQGSKAKGQFFSPYSVAEIIAGANFSDVREEISRQGYFSIAEPCVGAGAMLIAAANQLIAQGFDPSWQMWVEGQDLSYIAGLMAYVQISVMGIAGCIIAGADTLETPRGAGLTGEEQAKATFFTPAASHEAWYWRAMIKKYCKKVTSC